MVILVLCLESLGLERRRKQEAKKWARMDFLIRQQKGKGRARGPPRLPGHTRGTPQPWLQGGSTGG